MRVTAAEVLARQAGRTDWRPHTYWEHLDRAPCMWGEDVASAIAEARSSFEDGGGVVLYPDEELRGPDVDLVPFSWRTLG